MPLNVGAPIGSSAYATASSPNAYANAYAGVKSTPNFFNPTGSSKSSYRYPQALLDGVNGSSDYLEIKIIEYTPPGFSTSSGSLRLPTGAQKNSLKQGIAYIHLPIPQNLSDTNGVDWGEDRVDPLSAGGISAIYDTLGASNPFKQAGSEIENLIKTAIGTVQTGEGQKATQAAVSGSLLQSLGSNVSVGGILSRATGQVVNPNLELLFNGVTLRNFSFSFDLTPRSAFEGTEIKQIIGLLKKHMAAKSNTSSGSGLLIKSPEVFQLTFKSGSGDHPFLFKMKPTALLNINVDYAASGTYATYKDGTPVHMRMNLTFKELSPIYQEDYEGIGGVGY
jgi:hypothetical protein